MFVTPENAGKRTESNWKSFVQALSSLPLSHIHFVFPTTALLTHTHSHTPTPGPMHTTQPLSHKRCPLNPPVWKTLLWVCETVPRCKDVIGRHGECAWESVFFTWMEKYKLVFVRYIADPFGAGQSVHLLFRCHCKVAKTPQVCAVAVRNWSLIEYSTWRHG